MPTPTDRPAPAGPPAGSPRTPRGSRRPIRALFLIPLAAVGLGAGPGPPDSRIGNGTFLDSGPSATSPEGPDAGSFAFAPTEEAPRHRPGFLEVARESTFGLSDPPPWRPLALRSILEGWRDPWVLPPAGSSGALRKGWIGAPDGVSLRLYFLSYREDFRAPQGGNAYTGRLELYTPLSRRLLLITSIPGINANTPTFTAPTLDAGSSLIRPDRASGRGTSFGDLAFTPRVMLAESQDFSLVAQMTVQAPTGSTRSGAGRAILTPGVQFWSDIGRRRVLRGSFNVSSGLNGPGGGTTLLSQLAIGRTYTPHETPLLGDLTFYLAANVANQVSPTSFTSVTLGPGFRTHLGREYNLLGAVTVPVTDPQPYGLGLSVWLLKNF